MWCAICCFGNGRRFVIEVVHGSDVRLGVLVTAGTIEDGRDHPVVDVLATGLEEGPAALGPMAEYRALLALASQLLGQKTSLAWACHHEDAVSFGFADSLHDGGEVGRPPCKRDRVTERLAQEASESDVAQLRELLDEQARSVDDPAAFMTADEHFHVLMPRLLGLDRIAGILSSIRGIMWLIGAEVLGLPDRALDVLAEHEAVVDAIESGDASAAAGAIVHHLDCTANALVFEDKL